MPPLTAKQKAKVWADTLSGCSKCDISQFCDHKVTHFIYTPIPSPYVDILFIGEAPGESEYINEEPFIGPAGECLRSIIIEALDDDISYCITNSILCTPFTSEDRYKIRTPFLSEVKECQPHLAALYRKLQPKYIVALGKTAEKTILSLSRILPIKHYIQVLHPSRIVQAKDYNYQFDKASLAIQEYIAKWQTED